MSDFDLFLRAGLPDEIAALRRVHPRPWEDEDLGDLARFWLDRHDLFRRFAALLLPAADALRGGTLAPGDALPRLGPRIEAYLGELHGHHAIEDRHYFPVFRTADPRLSRAFEILDADHATLDGLIHRLVGTLNALRASTADPAAAERLGATLAGTVGAVARHLEDEEDIVIPLLIERTSLAL